MSKRAGAVSAQTKEDILTAAANELVLNGFQGTSLRKIAAAAGVTTGAIYFFFEGKDQLFEAVISKVTRPFMQFMKEHYESEHDFMNKKPSENLNEDIAISLRLIDFYFQNKKIWDILLRELNHPAVQEFIESFADYSAQHYMELLKLASEQQKRGKGIDPFAVQQYAHMQLDTMLTLISRDFSREEMTEHSRTVTKMLRAAFMSLLED